MAAVSASLPMLSASLTFHDALYSSAKMTEIVDALTSPSSGVEITDRRSFLRSYPKTFTAMELLQWLEKHAGFTREQAVFFARLLNTSHIIHNSSNRLSPFMEDDSYWRFQCHEEGPLNYKRVQIWDNDAGPCELVESLLAQLLRLVKRIVHIKNGSFAVTDLEALVSTKEFEQFELDAGDLQRVNLYGLSKDQKTAFWVNTYNLLALHGFASEVRQHRDPFVTTYFNSKRQFFTSLKYLVGGLEFSLDDIEQGILRAAPSYFPNGDSRAHFAVANSDVRFIWALNSVNKSSPAPLIIRYLGYACSRHMQSTLRIEEAAIVLPRQCYELCQPNASNHVDVILRFITGYLSVNQKRELARLTKENKLNLKFLDSDWEPRIDLKEFDLEPATIASKS